MINWWCIDPQELVHANRRDCKQSHSSKASKTMIHRVYNRPCIYGNSVPFPEYDICVDTVLHWLSREPTAAAAAALFGHSSSDAFSSKHGLGSQAQGIAPARLVSELRIYRPQNGPHSTLIDPPTCARNYTYVQVKYRWNLSWPCHTVSVIQQTHVTNLSPPLR